MEQRCFFVLLYYGSCIISLIYHNKCSRAQKTKKPQWPCNPAPITARIQHDTVSWALSGRGMDPLSWCCIVPHHQTHRGKEAHNTSQNLQPCLRSYTQHASITTWATLCSVKEQPTRSSRFGSSIQQLHARQWNATHPHFHFKRPWLRDANHHWQTPKLATGP